ncbi:MAG: hypothetical protein FWD01_00915, partial [Defluviitaleaceae bacterium]|nr:hypothetical protein [Defluviitaleaceae bacterium]
MRKFSKFLVVMLCLAVPVFGITSCSSTNVRNYFPFLSDTILTYESEDEEISYRIFVDYINENRMQRRLLLENGMMWVEVAEFRDNRLVHINTFNDLSAHIDMTTQLARGHSLILTGPIRLGTEWLQFPTTNDSRTRQITGTDIRVT